MTVTLNLERSTSSSSLNDDSFNSVDSRISEVSQSLSDNDPDLVQHRPVPAHVHSITTNVQAEHGTALPNTRTRPRNWGLLCCIIIGYFLGSGIFVSGFTIAVVCEDACDETLKKTPGLMMALGTILFTITFGTHQFKNWCEEIVAETR